MRHSREEAPSVEGAELNLVPYLDIVTNLVLFLMLSLTVALPMTEIEQDPPGVGPGGRATLTIAVDQDGYALLDGTSRHPVPGGLDATAELTSRLARVKAALGASAPSVVLVAAPDTPYEVIVRALDAARTDADGRELFPEVALGMPH